MPWLISSPASPSAAALAARTDRSGIGVEPREHQRELLAVEPRQRAQRGAAHAGVRRRPRRPPPTAAGCARAAAGPAPAAPRSSRPQARALEQRCHERHAARVAHRAQRRAAAWITTCASASLSSGATASIADASFSAPSPRARQRARRPGPTSAGPRAAPASAPAFSSRMAAQVAAHQSKRGRPSASSTDSAAGHVLQAHQREQRQPRQAARDRARCPGRRRGR